LPRAGRGIGHHQGDAEGFAWVRYLQRVCERIGLPLPPPAWALDDLARAGHAYLAECRLNARAAVETSPVEVRKLRSQARREGSTGRMAERVLRATLKEHREREATQPVAVADLVARIGAARAR
jgi:hypothetical protein